MIIDLFYKTYPKDYEFLRYSLRSMKKRAKGFRHIVVVTECEDPAQPHLIPEMEGTRYSAIDSKGMAEPFPGRINHGYEHQKAIKCMWPAFSNADAVFQVDSDYVLTGDLNAEDLFIDGQPVWTKRPFEEDPAGQKAWQAGTQWFAGRPVFTSYMCSPGFLVTRELANAFFKSVGHKYQCSPVELFLNPEIPQLSEYELLGWYAENSGVLENTYKFLHPSEFNLPIKQFWSWGNVTPDVRAELEDLDNEHAG